MPHPTIRPDIPQPGNIRPQPPPRLILNRHPRQLRVQIQHLFVLQRGHPCGRMDVMFGENLRSDDGSYTVEALQRFEDGARVGEVET